MLAAFRVPGALQRTVTMPFGEFPAAGFAAFRFTDMISHAWDLAKATGQNSDLAPDLCESALAMSRQRLEAATASAPVQGEVSISVEACAAARLAAYLGKQAR